MGHLENVLKKVKDKIEEYTESKPEVEPEVTPVSEYEKVIDLDGEVEDWYHDVGARGAFKS